MPRSGSADRDVERNDVREASIPAGGAALYSREIGKGLPAIVVHGGPDFDHSYLRPDLDRLSHSLRLVYYDWASVFFETTKSHRRGR